MQGVKLPIIHLDQTNKYKDGVGVEEEQSKT